MPHGSKLRTMQDFHKRSCGRKSPQQRRLEHSRVQVPRELHIRNDTYSVESFNNVLNIFHDKRISFGDDSYICVQDDDCTSHFHWNGNVDRYNTSVYEISSGEEKKTSVRRTYAYRHKFWCRFLDLLQN
uniref:Uncharacterized protein n=1 Tax=Magallana gigas TaxID=29159 RepID=K1QUH6_MAGGI